MRNPNVIGPAGAAWQSARTFSVSTPHATLALWLLQCPGQHPEYEFWSLGLIHLRPVPGLPEPHQFSQHQCGYEIVLVPLEPGSKPHPDVEWNLTTRNDLQIQFNAPSDSDACKLAEGIVADLLTGRFSPAREKPNSIKKVFRTVANTVVEGD